jgi:predicted DsbA family dithiol-disulfide isomerase
MPTLLFYHDFNSAFCRVGLVVAREAAAAAGIALEPVPYELFPAPVPVPAPDQALANEVAQAGPLAAQHGVELVLPPRLARTRKAHEAVVHARNEGLQSVLLDALYDAVWRDGLDIGRLDVIVDIAGRAGVDPGSLYVALGLDAHEPAVVRAQVGAEEAGVHGVPSFRLGSAVLAGAVPVAELLEWIEGQR